MQITDILYPTDFSEGSKNAAPYARSMAEKYGARLHLLHVVYDIATDTAWIGPLNMDKIYDEVKEGAKEELNRIARKHLDGVENLKQVVIVGKPFKEIVSYADDNNVGMIVMGTHGSKGIEGVLFGSTANRVVKRASCPVLTVKGQGKKKPGKR